MAKSPEGKRFYGSITVSERGQVVIPAEARRDFGIEVGDKLLVFGKLDDGIGLVKASMLLEKIPGIMAMLQSVENDDSGSEKESPRSEAERE